MLNRKKIKILLESNHMTYNDLMVEFERVGHKISLEAIKSWFAHKKHFTPRKETLVILAKVLNVRLDEILLLEDAELAEKKEIKESSVSDLLFKINCLEKEVAVLKKENELLRLEKTEYKQVINRLNDKIVRLEVHNAVQRIQNKRN